MADAKTCGIRTAGAGFNLDLIAVETKNEATGEVEMEILTPIMSVFITKQQAMQFFGLTERS